MIYLILTWLALLAICAALSVWHYRKETYKAIYPPTWFVLTTGVALLCLATATGKTT